MLIRRFLSFQDCDSTRLLLFKLRYLYINIPEVSWIWHKPDYGQVTEISFSNNQPYLKMYICIEKLYLKLHRGGNDKFSA